MGKTNTLTRWQLTRLIVLYCSTASLVAGALGMYIGYKYKGIRHPYVNHYKAEKKFKVLHEATEQVKSFMDSTYYIYARFNNSSFKKDSARLEKLLIPLDQSLRAINPAEGRTFTAVEQLTFGAGIRERGRDYIFVTHPDDGL